MASNGRLSHRMGGSIKPSFLLIALCLIITILLYSYWSLSSRNSLLLRDVTILQSRLRTLTGVESRNKKLMADLTRIHGDTSTLKGMVEKQKKIKTADDKQVVWLQQKLKAKQQSLEKMQGVEVQYKKELLGFKENVSNTSRKFKQLNERASKVLKLYNEFKQKNSELQKKVKLLESQVDRYKNADKNVLIKKRKDKQTGAPISKPLGQQKPGKGGKNPTAAAHFTQPDDSKVVTPPASKVHQKEDKNEDQEGEDDEGMQKVEIVKPRVNSTNDQNQTIKAHGNETKISGNVTVASHHDSNTTIESTGKLSNASSLSGNVEPTLLTAAPSSDISKESEEGKDNFPVNRMNGKMSRLQGQLKPLQHPGESQDNKIKSKSILGKEFGPVGTKSDAPHNPVKGQAKSGTLSKANLQNRLSNNVNQIHKPKPGKDHSTEDEEEDEQGARNEEEGGW